MKPTTGQRSPRVDRVKARRTFDRLGRPDGRGRSGTLVVRFVAEPDWARPQVAYAVGRRVGPAVVRNRLRRRLRSIVAQGAADLRPGAYMVSAGPEGPLLGFEELRMAMGQALEKAMKGAGSTGRVDRRRAS